PAAPERRSRSRGSWTTPVLRNAWRCWPITGGGPPSYGRMIRNQQVGGSSPPSGFLVHVRSPPAGPPTGRLVMPRNGLDGQAYSALGKLGRHRSGRGSPPAPSSASVAPRPPPGGFFY